MLHLLVTVGYTPWSRSRSGICYDCTAAAVMHIKRIRNYLSSHIICTQETTRHPQVNAHSAWGLLRADMMNRWPFEAPPLAHFQRALLRPMCLMWPMCLLYVPPIILQLPTHVMNTCYDK